MARACGNLGNCYYSTGDYGRARELHEQRRATSLALVRGGHGLLSLRSLPERQPAGPFGKRSFVTVNPSKV